MLKRSFIYSNNKYFRLETITNWFNKFKNILRKKNFFSTNQAGSNFNKNTTLPLTIDNLPWLQSLWIPLKSNSNETETFISLVEKDLFRDTSWKRISYRKMKRKRWKIGENMHYLIQTRARLWVYKTRGIGSLFIIVDKQTDHERANEQIERSSFLKIDYEPTTLHINKVKEWATKWMSRN